MTLLNASEGLRYDFRNSSQGGFKSEPILVYPYPPEQMHWGDSLVLRREACVGYSADMEWDRMLTFNSFREEKNNIIGVNSNAVGLYSQKEKKNNTCRMLPGSPSAVSCSH